MYYYFGHGMSSVETIAILHVARMIVPLNEHTWWYSYEERPVEWRLSNDKRFLISANVDDDGGVSGVTSLTSRQWAEAAPSSYHSGLRSCRCCRLANKT